MFAVIQVGSSQYKIKEGDTINIPLINKKPGSELEIKEVLMYAKGNDIRVGQPFLKDVKVSTQVVKNTTGPKLVAFKYRLRKDSASKIGHKQKLTSVNVVKISA